MCQKHTRWYFRGPFSAECDAAISAWRLPDSTDGVVSRSCPSFREHVSHVVVYLAMVRALRPVLFVGPCIIDAALYSWTWCTVSNHALTGLLAGALRKVHRDDREFLLDRTQEPFDEFLSRSSWRASPFA